MVAAGIMCQIYSMKGFSRKLSSGKKKKCQKVKEYFKKKEKQKKNMTNKTPHPRKGCLRAL